MEKQAHRFAAALLLPAETFASEVRVPPSLDNLLILKQRWGASVAVMMMRCHALGLLNDDEKLVLFKRRSARWSSKAEPGDDKWVPEALTSPSPDCEASCREGIVPAEGIPRHLVLGPRDVEKSCGKFDPDPRPVRLVQAGQGPLPVKARYFVDFVVPKLRLVLEKRS